jgi:hypothetical protein
MINPRDYLIPKRDLLVKFADRYHLRVDWHEPDEQEITAEITGNHLDNAGVPSEYRVVLKVDGKKKFEIDIATLLALATCDHRAK